VLNSKLSSLVLLCALTLGAQDAWSKRLGGGLSLGKQMPVVTQRSAATPALPVTQAPTAVNAAPRPATPAPAVAPQRPRGSVLGGLAAGLGLAWLATALGLGEAFAPVLLLALAALLVLAAIGLLMRRRVAPPSGLAYQSAGNVPGNSQFDPATPRGYNAKNVGNDASARPWEHQDSAQQGFDSTVSDDPTWGVPEGFDTAGFLKASKANFVSLQDAWDRSDIPALRAMMTDGMLEQIKVQLAEREQTQGGAVNRTEVVMLEARLLGIEEFPEGYMASVEFSGLIREDMSSGPNPFREVWNITRSRSGPGGWLVAGVQALQ
jgi:predicted lipid-binding transport protein (Tim44 family)